MIIMLFFLLFMTTLVNGLQCGDIKYDIVPLDIEKYSGVWYEYSHSNKFIFEKGCTCTQANYTLIDKNIVQVDNSCVKNGKLQHTIGTATLDPKINSRLNVKFFKFSPSAPYDVIYLDSSYETAVVLSCVLSNYNIWFLSKSPNPSNKSIKMAQNAVSQFDLNNQILTVHNC